MLSWLRRHRAEWKRESVTADEARRGRVHEGTPLKPPPPFKKILHRCLQPPSAAAYAALVSSSVRL